MSEHRRYWIYMDGDWSGGGSLSGLERGTSCVLQLAILDWLRFTAYNIDGIRWRASARLSIRFDGALVLLSFCEILLYKLVVVLRCDL